LGQPEKAKREHSSRLAPESDSEPTPWYDAQRTKGALDARPYRDGIAIHIGCQGSPHAIAVCDPRSMADAHAAVDLQPDSSF